jgi:asparagine N-glycosylation enzyme membrane subunit Stt3
MEWIAVAAAGFLVAGFFQLQKFYSLAKDNSVWKLFVIFLSLFFISLLLLSFGRKETFYFLLSSIAFLDISLILLHRRL